MTSKKSIEKLYDEIKNQNNFESPLCDIMHECKKFHASNKVQIKLKENILNYLKSISNKLVFLKYNKDIFSKNIIAVSGGFSAGKSEFINSLMFNDSAKLPVGIEPVTAIPTYVLNGNKNSFVINRINAHPISIDDNCDLYENISHKSLKQGNVNLKKYVSSLLLTTQIKYNNICFLDTPGYNPSSIINKHTEYDFITAKKSINVANSLIWVIGLDVNGTIPKSDLDFLSELDLDDKELFVVLNKADLKTENDIVQIIENVADVLDDYGLDYSGISAYSSLQKLELFYGNLSLDDFLDIQNTKTIDKNRKINDLLMLDKLVDLLFKYYSSLVSAGIVLNLYEFCEKLEDAIKLILGHKIYISSKLGYKVCSNSKKKLNNYKSRHIQKYNKSNLNKSFSTNISSYKNDGIFASLLSSYENNNSFDNLLSIYDDYSNTDNYSSPCKSKEFSTIKVDKYLKNTFKYRPINKQELKKLIDDENIDLIDIYPVCIEDFSGLFAGSKRKDFSGINTWNTSNVTDMSYMFYKCENFNEELNINTSNVVNMRYMFSGCSNFNKEINFDTSKATLHGLLFGCTSYTQKIKFATKEVIFSKYQPKDKEELERLLRYNSNVDLAEIDTSLITDMSCLFYDTSRDDYDRIANWDTCNVTNMRQMFAYCDYFNVKLNFDTSSVTDMSWMFCDCKIFNQPVNFDTSNVIDMSGMFYGCYSFNQPVNFNTQNVKDMNNMFGYCESFSQLLYFNTSNVKDFSCMFLGCKDLFGCFSFDVKKNANTHRMFEGCFLGMLSKY